MYRLLLFLNLLSAYSFAQGVSITSTSKLTVVDSSDLKPLSGVNISFNNKVFTTNAQGRAMISINATDANDTANISYVGYNSARTILHINKDYSDTLRLSRRTENLKEVVIGYKKNELVLGEPGALAKAKGGFYQGLNSEVAVYIANPNKVGGIIKSIEIGLIYEKGKGNFPFKLMLYRKQVNETVPQEELIKDTIIVYPTKGAAVVSVDISKYQLALPPDGFFASFQTFSKEWYAERNLPLDAGQGFIVPGLKGVFNKGRFRYDDVKPTRQTYSLHKNNTYDTWDRLEDGTDFAISAIIEL